MSNNQNKTSKKQQQKLLQQQRQMQQKQKEQEKRIKTQKLKQLAKKSTPLIDYGLLDSYQFFLGQLAASGIPQANVFQFAAQTILKFQKNKNKKDQKLRQVQKANEQAVKVVSQTIKPKQSKNKKQFKPQILPFKGDLDQKAMKILPKK